MKTSLAKRIELARTPLAAFARDFARVRDASARGGARNPTASALTDASTWALALVRGGAALRALAGSTFGMSGLARVVFHIDVWSDDIQGGLRLPHPFGIVIGEGAKIGEDCTLMHNVTIQRGTGTQVERGSVLGTGSVVLAGSRVGAGSMIGAQSVVSGVVPEGVVAFGAPARVRREIRREESGS